MADQKEMKRRLKMLMQKPENQVCSDCPERQPRWASLIVPPPGSPQGSTKIGAFCCLECSGSHRRLGVHISFVRSVNLDSWKEAEVLAMENGGNKKVNAIWEANLQRAGGRKPVTGADLNTRERYIRDKYERRRFYDPQALIQYRSSEPSFDEIGSKNQGGDFANFGPPPGGQVSDAAKLRAERKKKKAVPRNKSFDAPARTRSGGSNESAAGRRRVKNQEADPVVDLLDLGGAGASGAPAPGAPFADFFSPEATNGEAPGAAPTMDTPKRKSSRDGSRCRSKTRDHVRTKSQTADHELTRKNQQQDILNMYNTPASMGTGIGNGGTMNPAAVANNQVNMMAMMQQMQQMNMNSNPQQQQMGAMPGSGVSKHNSRLAMHQNLMMQQMRAQMQQQQNVQQMQRMMQQQAGGANAQMAGAMNPQMTQGGGMNPQMMQAMMQANQTNTTQGGMPNIQMNMNANMMMGMNPNMMLQPQQPINMMNLSQFGATSPSSGSPSPQNTSRQVPEKEDPFAQFGMNAFR